MTIDEIISELKKIPKAERKKELYIKDNVGHSYTLQDISLDKPEYKGSSFNPVVGNISPARFEDLIKAVR